MAGLLALSLVTAFTPGSVATAASHLRTCSRIDLRATADVKVAAIGRENPVAVRLTNTSSSPCTLRGYPRAELLDQRGHRLPFMVEDAGRDPQVTAHRPMRVQLIAGGAAFVIVSAPSCQAPARQILAATLRLGLPTGMGRWSLPIAHSTMAYCGRGRIASSLYVSPVEPTLLAATGASG
jgi:hypothetical protein